MTESMLRFPFLMGIGAATMAIILISLRWSPRTMMVIWTLVFFFVPIWIGAQAGAFYSAITVVTLLLIAASTFKEFQYSVIDILILGFALLIILGWALGWIQWGHLLIVFVGWMVPYIGGRLVTSRIDPRWVYTCMASGVLAAAILGIAEFFTVINVFVLLRMNNGLYRTWHALQSRGGELRVEGAFGHSIAFGASLALCSVFLLIVSWPQWVRLLSLLVVATAIGLTFSRIGLLCMVLTLGVGVFFLRKDVLPQFRWRVVTVSGLAAIVGIPLIADVFSSAGSEAAGSAAYRGDIFSLLDSASLLGLSDSWSQAADGAVHFGSFESIDSELVLTAVRFGLIPLSILMIALACGVASVMANRASAASVAVVGAIPAFATVAMITQYTTLVWFLAGLAVASYPRTSRAALPGTPSQPKHRMLEIPAGKGPQWR